MGLLYIATFTAVSTVTILRFGRLQKKVKSGAEHVGDWWVHKRQLSKLETRHTVLEEKEKQQQKKPVHTEYNDLLLSSVSPVKTKASGTASSEEATIKVAAATKMGSNSTDTGGEDDDFDAFMISTECYEGDDDDEKEMDIPKDILSAEEYNRMERFVADFHSMENHGFEERSGRTILSRHQNSTSSSSPSPSLQQRDESKKRSIVLERNDSYVLGP